MEAIRTVPDLRFDRVRAHTNPEINHEIDERTIHYLTLYSQADAELIGRRIAELEREWDMERILETNAASFSLLGLILGTFGNRKWFLLPTVVAAFLLTHAIQGWCPPVPWFRRMGVRTRKEIERERYALKLLCGDFDALHSGAERDPRRVLEVIDR